MKIRDLLPALGLRAAARTYGSEIETFHLESEGPVRFAQWQHPKCRPTLFSQSMVNELRRYLRPGDVVIDIGAHTGDTAVLFALAVGPSGLVFAVEPNRYAVPVLEENAKLNENAAPIIVFPYAASNDDQELIFQYSDPGYCNGGDLEQFKRHGHSYPLKVQGRNIQRIINEIYADVIGRIRLIKTDTEGNDKSVIYSFEEIIRRNRPYIICEVYKRTERNKREEFIDFMNDYLGYRCFLADPYNKLWGEEVHRGSVMNWPHFDLFCVPHNAEHLSLAQ